MKQFKLKRRENKKCMQTNWLGKILSNLFFNDCGKFDIKMTPPYSANNLQHEAPNENGYNMRIEIESNSNSIKLNLKLKENQFPWRQIGIQHPFKLKFTEQHESILYFPAWIFLLANSVLMNKFDC